MATLECKKSKHHGFYDTKKDGACRWCEPEADKSKTKTKEWYENGKYSHAKDHPAWLVSDEEYEKRMSHYFIK